MEQGLSLSTVALLAILVIGFYVFVIRRKSPDPAVVVKPESPDPPPGPAPTPNAPPEALDPFVVGNGEWGERLKIDVRYRKHGCDTSGAPTSETGAYDPDNELLEFWFEVEGPDRNGDTIPYSVFDGRGARVDSRWLPQGYFPVHYRNRNDPSSSTEQNALVSCFVGHSKDQPPIPLIDNMACGDGKPVIVVRPDPGPELGVMRITYKVRDPKGQEASSVLAKNVYSGSC